MLLSMFHDAYQLSSRQRQVVSDNLTGKTKNVRQLATILQLANGAGPNAPAASSPAKVPGGVEGLAGPFPVPDGARSPSIKSTTLPDQQALPAPAPPTSEYTHIYEGLLVGDQAEATLPPGLTAGLAEGVPLFTEEVPFPHFISRSAFKCPAPQ